MGLVVLDDDISFLNATVTALSDLAPVIAKTSIDEAYDAAIDPKTQLVLIDMKLGGAVDGLEFAEKLRLERPQLPLILITGFLEKQHAVKALRLGFVDILEKPFSLSELRDVCGRHLPYNAGLKLDDVRFQVQVDGGDAIDLTPTEFQLLKHFIEHPDREVSKVALQKALWGDRQIAKNTLDTHLSNLRKKIPQVRRHLISSGSTYLWKRQGAE